MLHICLYTSVFTMYSFVHADSGAGWGGVWWFAFVFAESGNFRGDTYGFHIWSVITYRKNRTY
jgi:hypothetical protein